MNKQAALGISIAGFVVLILSVFIPLYGLTYIGGIALALATVGAFFGERVFSVLTVVVSAVKVWFLSPTFKLMTSVNEGGDLALVYTIAIAAHAAPVIGLIIAHQRAQGVSPENTNQPTGMPRGK
nr:hypothetical protein [Nitrosomonas nitrosa]